MKWFSVRRLAPHTDTAAGKNRAFCARSTEQGIAESAAGDFQPVEEGGCSSMVEPQPSKLMAWVRFPSPAPSEGLQFPLT